MDIRRWLKTNGTCPEKKPAVTVSKPKVSSNPDRAEPLAGAGFEFPPLAVTTQPPLALSSETPFTSHSDPPGVTTPSASSSPPPIISYKFWGKESVHMPTSWVPTGAFIGLCDNFGRAHDAMLRKFCMFMFICSSAWRGILLLASVVFNVPPRTQCKCDLYLAVCVC